MISDNQRILEIKFVFHSVVKSSTPKPDLTTNGHDPEEMTINGLCNIVQVRSSSVGCRIESFCDLRFCTQSREYNYLRGVKSEYKTSGVMLWEF